MTTLVRWTGDGLADGHIVVSGDAGVGDTAITTATGSPTLSTSDTISPSVSLSSSATEGATSNLRWDTAETVSGRISFFMQTPSAWPSSQAELVWLRTADDASNVAAKISLAGSGQPGVLRLGNTSGTILSSPIGSPVMSLSSWYRVEAYFDQVNSMCQVTIYDTSNNPLWESDATSGDVGISLDGLWLGGGINSSPVTALKYGLLELTDDVSTPIGPVTVGAPAYEAGIYVWDGTNEVSVGGGSGDVGVLTLANNAPGTSFDVVYDGTDWKYAGDTVTSRPTDRDDLVMLCVNPVDSTVPSFALAGDRLLKVS